MCFLDASDVASDLARLREPALELLELELELELELLELELLELLERILPP